MTDKQKALEWVDSAIFQAERWGLGDDELLEDKMILVSVLRAIRSALEPKVVTVGWTKKWWKYGHSEKFWEPYLAGKRHQTEKFFREFFNQLGIAVKEEDNE